MSLPEALRRFKIGLAGCGHMGTSLAKGLVEHSFYPQNLYVFDSDPKKCASLKKEIPVRIVKSNRQLASICDGVILAVKPEVIESVLQEIGLVTPKTTLVISIAAGVKLSTLQNGFKEKVPVIRVMPNMPAQFGEGMAAYCLGSYATPHHERIAQAVLGAIGKAVPVKEGLMDAVTALSGSGPAYFFFLVEKMIEAAVGMGLRADMAKQLVVQTAVGSAKALQVTGEDPDALIERVASKKGTTEAALKVFRRKGFGKIVADAIEAACRRSRELSQFDRSPSSGDR